LGAEGVHYEGLYGLESLPAIPGQLLGAIERVAEMVPGAWVEEKGASAAVHVRAVSDPAAAEITLSRALTGAAAEHGYEIAPGKMVLDFVPAGRGRKGAAVEKLVKARVLKAVLYAGDDLADVEAFEVLKNLAAQGITTVAVAVRSAETPAGLLDAASVVVEGPGGLIDLLRQLA
jgi:trehalose 6-phosphate phosphatase